MINLALIGVGEWGKNYLSTIHSFPDARIKYICSKSESSLKAIDGDYIKTTDYLDLLDKSDINGVIIATPSSTHYEIAKIFLEHGFNLLVEKPMVLQYRQAEELRKIAKKEKAKVLIGHVYLFDPAYQALKYLIPELGNLESIHFEGLNNSPENILSVLWEYGSHPISMCLDLYSKKIARIQAWGTDETVTIRLMYVDGVETFIKLSWLAKSKKRELQIIGDKGELYYSALQNPKLVYKKKNMDGKKYVSYPKYADTKPLEAELRNFAESISQDKEVKISNIKMAVEVIKLLSLADRSIKSNSRVIEVN